MCGCGALSSQGHRRRVPVNRPRQQHEVEAVGPVPLSLVQNRPLLHQVLQVSGVHLQPSDHVIHVALVVLVVDFTGGRGHNQQGRWRRTWEGALFCSPKVITNV